MKTKNGKEDAIINKGLTMALECDQKAKEKGKIERDKIDVILDCVLGI